MLTKLTFTITALFMCLSSIRAQSNLAYLEKNKADVTASFTKGALLDRAFFDHQIFWLGEIHGVQKPQELDLNLLKLLNSQAGVHTYVAEVDFAKAYFLNQYLKTGNEKLLDTIFADWNQQYAQWANKDFQQKIRNIRKLNQTLPAARKIQFAGIDKIHNPVLVADYFNEVLLTHNLSNLKPRFSMLTALLRKPKTDSLVALEAKQLLEKLNQENNQGYYKPAYNQIIFALQNCANLTSAGRETTLYKNFKYMYQQLNWSKEKLYGFWGFFHVLQAKTNGGKGTSFTTALLNDNELNLKGKIVSIACLYSESKMMMPTAFLPPMWADKGKRYTAVDKFNNDGDLMNIGNLKPFKEASQPGTATLFKLNAAGSPFLTEKVEIKYNAFMPKEQQMMLNEEGKFLADYFQYLILIRNSAATTPIAN